MAVAVLRHLDTPTALGLKSAREGACVGTVGPHQFQTRQFAFAGMAGEKLRSKPIMQISGVDMGEG
jgi:hypothetical protein